MWTWMFGIVMASSSVDHAAAVHLSNRGLTGLVEGVAGVLDRGLLVGASSLAFQCDPGDEVPLTMAFEDLTLSLVTDEVSVRTEAGELVLHLDLGLTVDAPDVRLTGDCLGLLTGVDQTCDLAFPEPVDFVVDLRLGLAITDDGAIDATLSSYTWSLGTLPNPLSDCVLATIFDLLPRLSDPPNDRFFSDLAAQYIDPALADLGATLELAVEDGLAIFPLEIPVDLLGAPLTLSLDATSLELDGDGLFIGLALSTDGPWDPACVPPGPEGQQPEPPVAVGGGWPVADGAAWGGGAPYDMSILLSYSAVDLLLFDVWSAGLLCQDVTALSPLPIGTTLLGSVYGGSLGALFPVDQPVALTLSAAVRPMAGFDEGLVDLALSGLDLSLYSELDGRLANIARTRMEAAAVVDGTLANGRLVLDLGIDPESWTFTEVDDAVLAPGYAASLATGLPSLISSFLPADLLPAVVLPTFQGIGVGALAVHPSSDGRWQGLFLTLDLSSPEPILVEGCEGGCDGGVDLEGALGCDDTGCGGCGGGDEGCESSCEGGSCAVPGRGAARFGSVLMLVLWALRRRG